MDIPDEALRWFPLFLKPGRRFVDPTQEVVRLAHAARTVLDGPLLEDDLESAFFFLQSGHIQLADAVQEGKVPAAALEVLAGIGGVVAPHDEFTMDALGRAVWWLASPTLKSTSVAPALSRGEHATYPPVFDAWGRLKARPTDRESAQPASPVEHLVLVDRVAPLTVGGITFARLAEHRPVAWHNQHISMDWEALCYGMDVFAGSILAGERLVKLSKQFPSRPALAWLAEVSLRLARQPAAADLHAGWVDSWLAAAPFRNAVALAGIEPYREELRQHPERPGDAILRAVSRPRTRRPKKKDGIEEAVLARQPALERAARAGNKLARALVAIDDILEEDSIEVDWERDSQGQFHGLFPSEALIEPLNEGIAAMMCGFRSLYALELLAQALPELEPWLGRAAT